MVHSNFMFGNFFSNAYLQDKHLIFRLELLLDMLSTAGICNLPIYAHVLLHLFHHRSYKIFIPRKTYKFTKVTELWPWRVPP